MSERVCHHPNAVLETKADGGLMLACGECWSWAMRAPGMGTPTLGPSLIFVPDDDDELAS